jgi:tetratricopeptide (TPR) repeat protein
MNAKIYTTKLILLCAFIFRCSFALSQTGTPGLYSDVKFHDSKYLSQFEPGPTDALSNYTNDATARYNRNKATYNSLLNWLVDLIRTSPSFDENIRKTWTDFSNLLLSYGDRHSDFENSGPYLDETKNNITKLVNSYNKQLPTIYNDQGLKEDSAKNYEKAVQCFTFVKELNPDFPYIELRQGFAYYQLDEDDLALTDLNTYLSKNQNDGGAYHIRALIKFDLKDFIGSVKDLTTEIGIDPNSPYAFSCRAEAKDSLNDKLGAVMDYTIAIRLKPDFTEAYYNRGHAELHLKQNTKALIDYNRAISIGEAGNTAFLYRAELRFSQGDYKDCISDCSVVIDSYPKAPHSFLLRGRAYYKLGQTSKACEDWSKSGEQGLKAAYDYIFRYCK